MNDQVSISVEPPVNFQNCDMPEHLTVIERYFKCLYSIDLKGRRFEDHCILTHSNRICIVTLAKSHPIVAENKTIRQVSYLCSNGLNRLDNKVTGKAKKGAQWLNPFSPLCNIICEDGEQYTIYSCIRGNLVEVNENLIENPSLVNKKPQTEGYIAIVLPKIQEYEQEMKKLLSEEEYQKSIQNRKT